MRGAVSRAGGAREQRRGPDGPQVEALCPNRTSSRTGFRVGVLGFRFQGSGFRIQGLGFRFYF